MSHSCISLLHSVEGCCVPSVTDEGAETWGFLTVLCERLVSTDTHIHWASTVRALVLVVKTGRVLRAHLVGAGGQADGQCLTAS
jgi:hypothetical protein